MSLATPYGKHLRACKKQLIERTTPMTNPTIAALKELASNLARIMDDVRYENDEIPSQVMFNSLGFAHNDLAKVHRDAVALITQLEAETQGKEVDVVEGAHAIRDTVEGSSEFEEMHLIRPGIPYDDAIAFATACATAWNLTPSKRDGGVE